jgi:hypothetical protein
MSSEVASLCNELRVDPAVASRLVEEISSLKMLSLLEPADLVEVWFVTCFGCCRPHVLLFQLGMKQLAAKALINAAKAKLSSEPAIVPAATPGSCICCCCCLWTTSSSK